MLNAEGGSRVTLQPGADPMHDRFHGNEMNFEDQMAELERGAHEVLIGAELVRKLKRGVPLRVKAGFDPTSPVRRSRPRKYRRMQAATRPRSSRSSMAGAPVSNSTRAGCRPSRPPTWPSSPRTDRKSVV